MMRIAFVDLHSWDFHVGTVDSTPLGGAHSAACYLARALACRKHEVFLVSQTSAPGIYHGVRCLSWSTTNPTEIRSWRLDVLICVLAPKDWALLRRIAGPETRLILWTGHAVDQPDVAQLGDRNQRSMFDGFAMVSQWQQAEYSKSFGIEPARTAILRNAIAPAFDDMFPGDTPILPQKASPPVLAYTSTPFRGLHLLIAAFPSILSAVPGARLKVFSSMRVYGVSPESDERGFGDLYRQCRATEGVDYIGSLAQRELAFAMRGVTMLPYPNTFAETSCIAVMEAMASGCRIVTSDRGALAETSAGFARLIPVQGRTREAYLRQFIDETIEVLRDCARPDGGASEALLLRQVKYVNSNLTWTIVAGQWEAWLAILPRSAKRRDV